LETIDLWRPPTPQVYPLFEKGSLS
jgi:hypothetical protein